MVTDTIQSLTRFDYHKSLRAIASYIHLFSRHECQIQQFEAEHHVAVRWTPDMDVYKEAKRIATKGEQQKVKEKMLRATMERTFYINTLVHHAGIGLYYA